MADQSDRPEPDHTEDPRRQGMSDAGYPESDPAGAVPPGSAGEEQGPEAPPDPGQAAGAARAPGTSSPDDGDPQQATGNPDAAG
jgi:hypothetical protein